jgi:hypothetical protein
MRCLCVDMNCIRMLFGETPPPYTTRRRVPSLGSERQSKPTLASGRVAHGVGFQPKTLRNSQLIDIVFPIHPDGQTYLETAHALSLQLSNRFALQRGFIHFSVFFLVGFLKSFVDLRLRLPVRNFLLNAQVFLSYQTQAEKRKTIR